MVEKIDRFNYANESHKMRKYLLKCQILCTYHVIQALLIILINLI